MTGPEVREECVVCNEPITNPICAACLSEEVRQWLGEKGQDALARAVGDMTRAIAIGGDHSRASRKRWCWSHATTRCILCNSRMHLCAYCYTGEVFELVKEQTHLVEEFLTFCSFDLGHMGWEQEARTYIE